MQISNRFVTVCNIQIVIPMLYHSFEPLLLSSVFFLMAKSESGKSFVNTGSRFQVALSFYFIETSNNLSTRLFDFN